MEITFSANTHPGMRRPSNQDACITRPLRPDDKVLAVVIDGVGGYAGGEQAAAIAKDCIEQYMQLPKGDTLTMLREAVLFANNQVAAARKKDQRFGEMCCVLTALVADMATQRIYFVHVGDTRLYRYRDGKLQKLTKDHSLVGIREDAGELSESEAMAHPHRNQVLRTVGSAIHRLDDDNFMDHGSDALVPGDLLLLCSDGLTDMIDSAQVISVLSDSQPLTNKTARLVELANESGGYDNITVVLLQCPDAIATNNPVDGIAVRPKDIATAETIKVQMNRKKDPQWQKPVLASAFLLLVLIAGAGLYFTTPNHALGAEDRRLVIAPPAGIPLQDSISVRPAGRSIHPAVQGPATPEKTDTLRISTTQNFADLKKYTDSSGKSLVLVPKDHTSNHFAAIAITVRSVQAGDTLVIRKLRLIGFEHGIDIQLPIVLQTENLVFENVHQPFRCLFKPGEKHPSILFMNNPKQ
jgi:PPM family protein phosphatase